MDTRQVLQCFMDAAVVMPGHQDTLCRLDLTIGDGDHGVTIARGYRAVTEGVLLTDDTRPADFFAAVSGFMMDAMGGAIGPVYGLLYEGLRDAHAQASAITAASLADGMLLGAQRIATLCGVAPGDKTVYDALLPAADALDAHRTAPLGTALAQALEAARTGRDATSVMMAQKGRARFLREKSIGPVDPGACSFVCWLEALLAAIEERENP